MQIQHRTTVTLNPNSSLYIWENETHTCLHLSGGINNHHLNIEFTPSQIPQLEELLTKLRQLQIRHCNSQISQLQETLQSLEPSIPNNSQNNGQELNTSESDSHQLEKAISS
jgi:hypothetical protein